MQATRIILLIVIWIFSLLTTLFLNIIPLQIVGIILVIILPISLIVYWSKQKKLIKSMYKGESVIIAQEVTSNLNDFKLPLLGIGKKIEFYRFSGFLLLTKNYLVFCKSYLNPERGEKIEFLVNKISNLNVKFNANYMARELFFDYDGKTIVFSKANVNRYMNKIKELQAQSNKV